MTNDTVQGAGYFVAGQDWNDLQRYLSVSVLTIVDVSAVFLNSLVVSIILMDRELREKPDSLLIANLALSDLLVSLTIIPFSIDTLIHKKIRFSDTTAAFLGFANFAFCIASIMTLMVLVIDQTLTIKFPFKYTEYRTQKAAVYAMIGTWVHSISCALPPMFGLSSYSCFIVNTGPCSNYQWAGTNGSVVFTILVTSLSWGLALAVTVACYVQIATIAVKQKSIVTKEKIHLSKNSKRFKQNMSDISVNTVGSTLSPLPTCTGKLHNVVGINSPENHRKYGSSLDVNVTKHQAGSGPTSIECDLQKSPSHFKTSIAHIREYSLILKPAITLLLIIITYFFTWSPFCILLLVEIAEERKAYRELGLIFLWIGHCSSLLNPIIYFLRYRKFRSVLNRSRKKLFTKVAGSKTFQGTASLPRNRKICSLKVTSTTVSTAAIKADK